METLPLTPIENVDRLMAVAQESAEELKKAIMIIRSRDRIIAVAIDALTEIGKKGDPAAIKALGDMRAIHQEYA
jgi:hypothetical protein